MKKILCTMSLIATCCANAMYTINEPIQKPSTQKREEKMIADPSFDGTFKTIFTFENKTNNISGNDRLKSLLNSLLHPNASGNDFMIRDITALPSDMTNIGNSSLGTLKSDIVCRCSCWSDTQEKQKMVFDIEMQTGFDSAFENRLFNYATTLKQKNGGIHVIVLAFLNYEKPEKDYSVALYKKTEDSAPIYIPNNLDIYSVHLGNINKKLRQEEEIKIADKPIGSIGKEWLRLLSARHPEKHENGLYPSPKVSDECVKSAVIMLQNYKQDELAECVRLESEAKGLLDTAKLEGKIEMAKNLLLAGGIDIEIIANASGLSILEIEELKSSK